jgi:hypothetical protein
MVSSLSSSSSSKSHSSSSDNEVFYDMDQEAIMFFRARFIACTFGDLFIIIEMEEGGGHYVDPTTSV